MGVKVRELPRKCFSWRDKNSSCSMTLCNAYLIIVNEILSYSSVCKEEKQLIWLKSPCKGVNKGKLILWEQYEHLDYKKIKPWGSSRTKWIQGKGKLSKNGKQNLDWGTLARYKNMYQIGLLGAFHIGPLPASCILRNNKETWLLWLWKALQ